MDKKLATQQVVVKISLFGSAYVGKTSLIRKFCNDEFDERHTRSTCGLDVEEKIIEVYGQKVQLKIWDSAGQERFTDHLSALYFQKKQGILLMYSVDDRKSFEKVQFWMSQVIEKAPKDVIKILVASKCDSENIEVTTKEGVNLAETYKIRFVETSSKDGTGVDVPFNMIAEDFVELIRGESTAATFGEKTLLNNFDIDEIRTPAPQRLKKPQFCCLSC